MSRLGFIDVGIVELTDVTLRNLPLRVRAVENRGAIVGADVVALAVQGGGSKIVK